MITIRRATENDYDALARIWTDGSVLPAAGIRKPAPGLYEELRLRLPREIDETGWHVFAAVNDDGKVAGLLAYDLVERCLTELFVARGKRSRGIGKALLDHAKETMPCGFWLRTRIENTRAQRFYERERLKHTHDAPHPRHPEAMFRHYEWRIASSE